MLPNDSLQKEILSAKYDEWDLFLHPWRLSSSINFNPTLENNDYCTIRLDHNVIKQPAPQHLSIQSTLHAFFRHSNRIVRMASV